MNMLDRYVARTVLGAVLLVMSVLMVLGFLFLFIDQQGDIGVGHFGTVDALIYSLMNLPQFITKALPAGALIGALLGMGVLARSHELTAMRATGMSKGHIARAALLGGVVLVIGGLLLGEWLAPPLEQLGDQRKAFAKYSDVSFAGRGGAWIRDGNRILNVERRSANDEYGGMMLFDIGPNQQLLRVARADRASATDPQHWELRGFAASNFEGFQRVTATSAQSEPLSTGASAGFLQLANVAPQELSALTLYRMIHYLDANRLRASDYVFALWSRLARNVAILVAVFFAVPFAFGSLRTAGAGARTTLGLVIGLVYFFLQRLVESGTAVFSLNPTLLAWLPCSLLAAAALILYWRVR